MLAYIKGTLEIKLKNYVVIDVGGLGYKVFMSESSIDSLGEIGEIVKVHTYYRVREDDISIYGFKTQEELRTFELLLGVSGVGAKSAVVMLSCIEPSEFAIAVISNNVKLLTQVPGIGTKSAQRIILELKDKLKMEDMMDAAYEQSIVQDTQDLNAARDAILALVNLGYSNSEAALAVKKIGDTSQMDIESILKAALKKLI